MAVPEARILVVDDEPGITKLCQRILQRAGFMVHTATRPANALELLQEEKMDLLLVDIRMPEVDGFELMRSARHHQPDLAVVIMTGFGTVETAIEALRQGADGLILKPFAENRELVLSVQDALLESQNKREVARLLALRPLFSITEALFSETDPDHLMALILEAFSSHLKCQHVGVYYHRPDETQLNLIASIGEPLPGEPSDPHGGPIGRAHSLSEALNVNSDGPGDPVLKETLVKHKLSSVLCAPMEQDREKRVVFAGRGVGNPIFSESDVEMFGILIRQAAVALENARLYAELRDYIRQVEESQNALIQAEKMAAVGRLTASIAHEINNPLQAVRNCLHLAKRMELSLEKRENYIDLAEGELNRLMSTVSRMLDFYRPGTIAREPANLNALVERVLQLLKKQLDEQKIQVHTKLSTRIPKVQVASNQMQQVFFNLILNAMEAMDGGGDLFVQSKLNKGTVLISFEDSGPGVPEEMREQVFEPFTSTREQGTGLGLSVSYNILYAHGGTLELVSKPDRGACFHVTLPVGEA